MNGRKYRREINVRFKVRELPDIQYSSLNVQLS